MKLDVRLLVYAAVVTVFLPAGGAMLLAGWLVLGDVVLVTGAVSLFALVFRANMLRCARPAARR